jgi:hypothetical protein
MVFILTVACAAGLVGLRCGCLPKEDAGQTVIEIMDAPTPAEMKAHVTRVLSGEISKRAVKLAFNQSDPEGVQQEREERLRENLEASATGPFITITTFDKQRSSAEMANVVARAYEEYLINGIEESSRRFRQALMAQITLEESATEKARLEWLDLTRRHGFTPDGKSLSDAAVAKETATRLAKARADLIILESRAAGLKDDDPAKASAATDVQALRDTIKQFTAATAEMDAAAFSREQNRAEVDIAKEKYERLRNHLSRMKQENLDRNLKESVVLMPVRVIEEARPVKVPDRRIRKFVRFGVIVSAALIVALLLSAAARRLCRRGP